MTRTFSPLLSDLEDDLPALTAFSLRVAQPRTAVVRNALATAVGRGELRPDAPFDLVSDLLEGPLMHRALLSPGLELDQDLLDAVLTSCLTLLGAR